MPSFFARPNLSDEQFKQLNGTTLTLSGQTRIATVTGFSISDGTKNVPIIVTGGTLGKVLTYDSTTCQITLQSAPGSGGGLYSGASPTTCTVGGLVCNSPISGLPISDILQSILVPTVCPAVVAPSHSAFIVSPSTSIYEIGTCISLCVTSCFSRGCITPQYCGACCFRSGLASAYNYVDFGVPTVVSSIACCNCHALSTYQINTPTNTISGSITYSSGATPAYNSSGGIYCTTLISGTTTPTRSCTITGIYPWFWGYSTAAPTINQALIDSISTCGCKCVGSSNGSINVDNFNVTGKYIWFAIPTTCPAKTSWQGANNPSNNGFIPGALFPAGIACTVNSPSCDAPSCWTAQSYSFYVSSYATSINYGMAFNN